MAQEGVIRNFMVALGFKTDNTGLGQMQDAMKGVELKAVALKGALLALATGAVIAVRQTASELDKLYFSSQRIGASATNITAFGNAITQMGGNAESAIGTLETLAEKVRNSPGYEGMLNSLGVDTKQANGDMRDRVEVMKDLSGVLAQMPAYQANAYAQSLGIDQNTLLAMRDGKFLQNMEKYQKIQEQLGMNDDLTKSGNEFMTEYRDLTMMTKTGFQVVVMQAGKALIPILRLLNQLLQSGIQAFSQLNPQVKDMLGVGLRFTMVALAFSGVIRVFGMLARFLPTIKNLIWVLKALRLAFLSSPLGIILALGAALALLYDDYKTWKEGGESLIDWSKWSKDIDKGLAILGSIYDWVSSFVSKVIDEFGKLDPAIQAVIGSISGLAIIGVLIAKHGFGIKYFTMAKKSALGLAKVLRALFKVFAFTPIGRAIALIGLLITAIGWLIKDFNKWKSGADSFLPWAKWSKSIDKVMDKIRGFLSLLGEFKDRTIKFVQKFLADPMGAIKDVLNGNTGDDKAPSKPPEETSDTVKAINETSRAIVDGTKEMLGKGLDILGNVIFPSANASVVAPTTYNPNPEPKESAFDKATEAAKVITQKGVDAAVSVGKLVDQTVRESLAVQKTSFSNNTLRLSKQDIEDLIKVTSTEVVASLKGEAFTKQTRGVVDTILNRVASGKWGSTVRDVANAKRQFTKITGPKFYKTKSGKIIKLNPYGSVQNMPLKDINPKVQAAVLSYLADREKGRESSVGGNLNYANPYVSDKKNREAWVDEFYDKALKSGMVFGSGKNVHGHGTTMDLVKYIPKPFKISIHSITPKTPNNSEFFAPNTVIKNNAPPHGNPEKSQLNSVNSHPDLSTVTIHQEFKTDMTINGAREPVESANAIKRQQENSLVIMARNAKGLIT